MSAPLRRIVELGDGVSMLVDAPEDATPAALVGEGIQQISADTSTGAAAIDDAIEAVKRFGHRVHEAVSDVAPTKASVEFTVNLEFHEGKLLALLCSASSSGAIRITLEWG